jgi:hypothetical protein
MSDTKAFTNVRFAPFGDAVTVCVLRVWRATYGGKAVQFVDADKLYPATNRGMAPPLVSVCIRHGSLDLAATAHARARWNFIPEQGPRRCSTPTRAAWRASVRWAEL